PTCLLPRSARNLRPLAPSPLPPPPNPSPAPADPATTPSQPRHDVDANYVALAVSLLEGSRQGHKVRLGLGTHDVRLIEQIAEHADRKGTRLNSSHQIISHAFVCV